MTIRNEPNPNYLDEVIDYWKNRKEELLHIYEVKSRENSDRVNKHLTLITIMLSMILITSTFVLSLYNSQITIASTIFNNANNNLAYIVTQNLTDKNPYFTIYTNQLFNMSFSSYDSANISLPFIAGGIIFLLLIVGIVAAFIFIASKKSDEERTCMGQRLVTLISIVKTLESLKINLPSELNRKSFKNRLSQVQISEKQYESILIQIVSELKSGELLG